MVKLAALVLCVPLAAFAQTPPSDSADKAAAAAQKAAEAAAAAAEAAARSAAAVEKAAAALAGAPAKPAEAPPKPVEALTPAEKKAPIWTGLLGLGFVSVTGNAQSLTFKANAAFERKGEEWIWGIKASGLYGQSQAVGQNNQTIAEAASASARGDRRFSEQLSAYLIAGIDTDHVKQVEERPYGEVGVSLIWWDTKEKDAGGKDFQKSFLRTDLGFRYGREYRWLYFDPAPTTPPRELPLVDKREVDIVAPHAGVLLRYAINKDIIFSQDLDLVPNLVGDARLLATANSKLAARLTDNVNLGVTFTVQYDSKPAAGVTSNTDTSLSVGLEVGL